MATKESAVMTGEAVDQGQTSKKQHKYSAYDTRLTKVELGVADLQDSVKEMEETVERLDNNFDALDKTQDRLEAMVEKVRDEARVELQGLLNQLSGSIKEELAKAKTSIDGQFKGVWEAIESIKEDLALCKSAIAGGTVAQDSPKIKVPEPPRYQGKQDAKELDYFLWSMEKYFDALHLVDDTAKINTAVMYLREDAILWWRRREADRRSGTCSINTWDEFKVDFKRQFYRENAEEVAMKMLRGLKHTGSIKDYI